MNRRFFYVVVILLAAYLAPRSALYAGEKVAQVNASLASVASRMSNKGIDAGQLRTRLLMPGSANSNAATAANTNIPQSAGRAGNRRHRARLSAASGIVSSPTLYKPQKPFVASKKRSVQGSGVSRSTAIQSLVNRNPGPKNFSAVFDGDSVRVLRGKFALATRGQISAQAGSFSDLAKNFVAENRALFGLKKPASQLDVKRSWSDDLGRDHVVYQKLHNGVPILNEEISLHGLRDHIYYVNARYKNLTLDPDSAVQLNADQALGVIQQNLSYPVSAFNKTTDPKLILMESNGRYRYVYELEILTVDMVNWYYLVDADSGDILLARNNTRSELVSASGRDGNGQLRQFTAWREEQTYYLLDPSTPSPDVSYDPVNRSNNRGDQVTLDARNAETFDHLFYSVSAAIDAGWDRVGVSVHANTKRTYEYYRDAHGRHSIDDKGMSLVSIIHFSSLLNNAFWNGQVMVYGDGDGTVFSPLGDCLDVTAHELTHGVIEHSANLIYQNQSGALNESFADIMAAMVDDDDWLMGEDCTLAAPGYLRSLSSPNSGLAYQPKNMSEYQHLPNTEDGDWGGVHVNSGIPNRVAYLVAEGLSNEGAGTSVGRTATGKIFYRALTQYLNATAEFVDARYATEQAAADLYGANSRETTAVSVAWDVVGVGASAPPGDGNGQIEAEAGQDFIAYLHPIDGSYDDSDPEHFAVFSQLIPDPFIAYDKALDFGPLNVQQGAQPTRLAPVTHEGEYFILYVGLDFNVYIINPDGSEKLLLDGNKTSSIAISPDFRFLATTPRDIYDNNIYIYDFVTEQWQTYELRSPYFSEGAGLLSTALYADSISFDYTGRNLIYDYFSCVPQPGKPCDPVEPFGYWSIGELDVVNGRFSFPFPAQPPYIDLGFPHFANNSNRHFVFDVNSYEDFDATGAVQTGVFIFDSLSQEFELVGVPGIEGASDSAWGVPSFSGDDDYVVYQADNEITGGKSGVGTPVSNYQRTGGALQLWNTFDVGYPTAHRNSTRDVGAILNPSLSSLQFGEVFAEGSAVGEFTIENSGNRAIEISNVAITGEYFTHDLTNTSLSPDETITVTVNLSAGRIGGKVAEVLVIDHNADHPELIINLRATIVGSDVSIDPVDANGNGRVDWDEGVRVGDITITASDMQLLRLYSGALGRIPDLEGFDFWRKRIATGSGFSQIGDEFYWSSELQIQMDADGNGIVVNDELVNHLYVNVLQRTADVDGFNYWIGRLQAGDSFGFVIASFLNGQEHIDSTVGLLADFALDNPDLWD